MSEKSEFAVEKPFRNSIMKLTRMLGNMIAWLERRSKVSLMAAGLVLVVLIGAAYLARAKRRRSVA